MLENLETITTIVPIEIPISEGQRQRWDKDINTIVSLSDSLHSMGITFVLSDGYAVEGHCGGEMTRPHGDIDGKLYIANSTQLTTEETAAMITDLLNKENTVWQRHFTQIDGKIEFREVAEDKEWRERRRIELNLINLSTDLQLQKKVLIDSHGKAHKIDVEGIDSLVAKKLLIINSRLDITEEEKRKFTRPLQQQDIDEVKRLISQPGFNRENTISKLAKIIPRAQDVSDQEVRSRSEYQFERVLSAKVLSLT